MYVIEIQLADFNEALNRLLTTLTHSVSKLEPSPVDIDPCNIRSSRFFIEVFVTVSRTSQT